MKTQKTTVKLIIDDVFNLGDVEVEWVASLVVNSSGITVKWRFQIKSFIFPVQRKTLLMT